MVYWRALRGVFMLKILRKYQKAIFAVVAFMVIASFSFFGTYGTIGVERYEEEDKVVGQAIDGSDLSSKEIAQLTRFLDTDFQDVMNGDGRGSVNLLNDGFLRNDILKSGLGALLFEAYKDEIYAEINAKVVKFKEFKPYVHPNKFISFEGMLKQFAPNYYGDLSKFRAAQGESEVFATLATLYLDQALFPSEMMRKMMMYVEYQYANMAPQDPQLRSVDLSLFYARSATDWFGQKFLEKVAHLVCNGAIFAKKQGYKVSFEEAKSSLMQLGTKHLKELEHDKVITSQDLNRFYKQQMAMLQMEEKDAVKAWQKILVFRKMLDEVGSSVFVDSLLYKQFSEFASKGAKAELYKLPQSIQVKTAEDMMKLEMYLDGVSKKREGILLPEELLSVEEIKRRVPELVEKRFLVKIASVKKSDLVSEIGVRKTWDWQLDATHWSVLKGAFPELAKCKSEDPEERFHYLGTLEESAREKIDQFSRKQILEEDSSFVKERLLKIDPQRRLLSITAEGEGDILPGVANRKALLGLLETGAMQGEGNNEALSCYSENGENFYRIQIVDRSPFWEALTFEEANQRGVLDHLLEKRLKEEYRKRHYSSEFKEVEDQLQERVFAGLLSKIRESEDGGEEGWEFAVTHRLAPFMRKMQQVVVAGSEEVAGDAEVSTAVSRETLQPKAPLNAQWKLKREEVQITRKMADARFDEKLFAMQPGDWSEVMCGESGPIFYKVLETFVDTSDVGQKMEEGRALLGVEAKGRFMKTLLDEIRTKEKR